jgi:hypothetical protein
MVRAVHDVIVVAQQRIITKYRKTFVNPQGLVRQSGLQFGDRKMVSRINDVSMLMCQLRCGSTGLPGQLLRDNSLEIDNRYMGMQLRLFSTEFITESPQGLQQGWLVGKRPINLIAQVADVDFDSIGKHQSFFVPDMRNDHVLGNNLAWMMHKVFQQGELFVRQLNGFIATMHFVAGGVE